MLDIPQSLLVAGLLVMISILSSKLSDRIGIPTLLMFLGVGMLAGSDGPGGIYFDNALLANAVGTVALAYILFAGGLDTSWPSVRPVLWRGMALATLGVGITAVVLGAVAWAVLDMPPLEAMLLASIVSSTDAAAVFAILRSHNVSLKGNLRPMLELESGSNDPMAIFLTIGLLQMLGSPDAPLLDLVPLFLLQMGLGAAAGLAMGRAATWLLNRVHLDYEGLYPVLTISIVMLAFGFAELIAGNGFLAVYLCGIVLGNSTFLHKRSLIRFHDGLGWLMQIGMFLVLGLLVTPSHIPRVVLPGLIVAGVLMSVARPVAVYLCLLRSGFTLRERTLIAWTGLRGAVPIVLATFPMLAGYERSELLFHVVFFVVLTSVLLQGRSLMIVARWLGVDKPLDERPRYPLEFDPTGDMTGETRELEVPPDSAAAGKRVADLGLPPNLLILLIRRGQKFVVPRGDTRIEPNDTLLVLAEPESLTRVRATLDKKAPEGGRDG